MKSSVKKRKDASKDSNLSKVAILKTGSNKVEAPNMSSNISRFASSIYLKDLEQQSLKSANVFIGEYQLLFVIGRGAHGKVLLVRNEKNGQNYVMKLLNLVTEDLSNIMKEKMVLQKISGGCCEFLARVHDYVLTSGHVGFVMEYVPGITLKDQISLVKNFLDEKTIFYTACVVLALEYLHGINIFHRDVALQNMIVDELGYVKIIDFGLSMNKSDIFQGSSFTRMNKMIDYEDMGRCSWQMATGEEIHTVPNYSKVSKISPDVRKFIQMIFPEGETSKLSESNEAIKEIKSHGFFKNIDWMALGEKKLKPPFNVKILPAMTQVKSVWQEVTASEETSVNRMLTRDFRNVIPWKSDIQG